MAGCAGIPSGRLRMSDSAGAARRWRDGKEAQVSVERQRVWVRRTGYAGVLKDVTEALSGRDHQARRLQRGPTGPLSPAARSVWRGTTRVVQAALRLSSNCESSNSPPAVPSIPFPLRAPHRRIERRAVPRAEGAGKIRRAACWDL